MEKKAGFILLLITRAALATADPGIICSSEPVEAAVSEDVTLQCHLVPPLNATNMTVEWRHESQNQTLLLNQDGHTSLFPEELTKGNLSLKISSVQLSDSGRYRCSVSRENLQHSCYVNLTVVPAGDINRTEQIYNSNSEIICSSKPVEATVSEDVTLQCHLVPPLDARNTIIKWRHESQDRTLRLNQDGHTSLFLEELTKGNLSLKISSVQLSDSGRYRCSVSRENLQHSCYVDLTVGQTHGLAIGISVAVVLLVIIAFAMCFCCTSGTTCTVDGCLKFSLDICMGVCETLLEAAD